MINLEILVRRQKFKLRIKGEETINIHEFYKWKRSISNSWLLNLQYHIGFDGRSCNNIRRTYLLKISYWITYSKKWENRSLHKETNKRSTLSININKKGNIRLFIEKSMGLWIQLRINYRRYPILINYKFYLYAFILN